jgi:hypothetical protein
VGDLTPDCAVWLGVPGLLRRGARPRRVPLDKLILTTLHVTPAGTLVGLRNKPGPGGAGFDLALAAGEDHTGEIRRVDPEQPGPAEPPVPIGVDDLPGIVRLIDALREASRDLQSHLGRLERVVYGDGSATEGDAPPEVAKRLVELVAPEAAEITRRGSSRAELALKHDLGGGRREEIYIARDELARQLDRLSPAARAVFAPLDLLPAAGLRPATPAPLQSGVIVTVRSVTPPLPAVGSR